MNETGRLYAVLDRRLAGREFINGFGYSIADIACYPWIVPHENQGQDLSRFPDLKRWFESIRERPATQRAYDIGKRISTRESAVDEQARKFLFGQNAEMVQRARQ